jgi:hypothetical protein
MLQSPDFEPEFYLAQNEMMCRRYMARFKEWGIRWSPYISDVRKRLCDKPYWIWVFLTGFERFLQTRGLGDVTQRALDEDKDERIGRVIGDFYKVSRYVKGL